MEVAELPPGLSLEPWEEELSEHPLRMHWARTGGPAKLIEWADLRMAELGLRRSGPAEQIRTWNLSTLWRLPTPEGALWLKAVPPFFAHEGKLLKALSESTAGARVPHVLAEDAGRVLRHEIPGKDFYVVDEARALDMVSRLTELQQRWLGKTESLLALGLKDSRAPALSDSIRKLVARKAPTLGVEERYVLEAFADDLPRRFAEVEHAGLPDGLVHGDFHPGNVRGTDSELRLLDWGDSCVGHPLLDESTFLERIPPESVPHVREHWYALLRRMLPGSRPERAAALLAPVVAADKAVTFQAFLDHIEPSEHGYHRADPATFLAHTVELLHKEYLHS